MDQEASGSVDLLQLWISICLSSRSLSLYFLPYHMALDSPRTLLLDPGSAQYVASYWSVAMRSPRRCVVLANPLNFQIFVVVTLCFRRYILPLFYIWKVVAQHTNRDGVVLSVLQMDPNLSREFRNFLCVRQYLARVKTADHTGIVKVHSTCTKILQFMETPKMDLLIFSTLCLWKITPAQ